MIAGAVAVASLAATEAAEDLSSYGTRVETTAPEPPAADPNRWPAQVCAEVLRVEKIVISGPLHPSDRGIARGGLLMLEQLHCGIDVSKKMAADQAAAQPPEPPAPPPVLNCFTSRLGGGMSTTTCR
jgi:hypothetical protein